MADLELAIKSLRSGKIEQAKKLFLNFSRHDERYLDSQLYLAHISDIECDWDNRKEKIECLRDLCYRSLEKHDNVFKFPICYLPFEMEDPELIELGKRKMIEFSSIEPLILRKQNNNNLRVGFVSIDFRSHSNGSDLSPIFKSCRESGIEIYGYSYSQKVNGVSIKDELKGHFDFYREILIDSAKDVAKLIASDSIDILIDTTRNIEGSPEKIFYYKPAPIQVSGWGYGPTNGSTVFNYFISGEGMVSEVEQQFYLERISNIVHYNPLCFDCMKSNRGDEMELSFNRPLVFGVFGATYKLRPELFDVWIEILCHLSGSRLYMIVDSQKVKENISYYLKKAGLSIDRVVFINRLSIEMFQNLLENEIDIVLDNPLMGGSNSFIQAHRLAIPTVTYEANGFAGRGSACIGKSIGRNFYTAKSLAEYKEVVFKLINGEIILREPNLSSQNYGALIRSFC